MPFQPVIRLLGVARNLANGFPARLLAVLLAWGLGLGWRRRQSGITERRVTVAALAAMPGFWLGILLMLVLAVQLGWLPPSGKGSPSHLFMPVFTVGILGGLWIALEMRSREAASEILVLARALGLVLRHVGILLSGIILVEFVFALPGMGLLLANAARAQDIAVVGTAAAVFIWMALLSRFLGNLLLAAIDGTPPARTGASGGTESWPALAIGGGVTLGLLLLLFLAPPLAPQDPIMASITERLAPPFWVDAKVVGGLEQPAGSWNHPLGTDRLGRDVLSRVLYGGRTAALIGLPMALLALLVGFPMVIARVMLDRTRAWSLIYGIEGVLEGMVAVPWLLIGVLIQVSLGGGWPFLALAAMLLSRALRVGWALGAGESLQVAQLAPVALRLGALFLAATLAMSAALVFFGLGVPPPQPDLGGMVADGRALIVFHPWVFFVPGLVLSLIIATWLVVATWFARSGQEYRPVGWAQTMS